MERVIKTSVSKLQHFASLRLGSATLLVHLSVFIILTITAKASLYVFFTLNTSPALILPPVGIAVAAVFLEGFSMWIPIALSQLAVQMMLPTQVPLFVSLAYVIAYTVQPLLAGFLLKKLDFNPSFSRIRDSVLFVLVAAIVPSLAPGVMAIVTTAFSVGTGPLWLMWSRAWAGGVVSVLIVTSFITAQFTTQNKQIRRRSPQEKFFACLCVAGATYITFWTDLPQQNVLVVLSVQFLTLLWIGLRTGPRIMTLALLIFSAGGILGTIIAHPTDIPLNQQLLSDELFIALIAPIFLIFAALVEERRIASILLAQNIERLEDALKQISDEDQAKNDFLAILAHELRNPLASVVTNLEVVKMHTEEIGNADILKAADIGISHAATITHLLEDLLDVSRISKRKFTLQKKHIELLPIVTHALQTVEPTYKARGQILTVSAPKEAVYLMADPLRLEQILVNLLNNASKFSHKKGRVDLQTTKTKQGEVRIAIRDEGIGIRQEKLQEIFEPFAQIPDRKGISNSGLGIGLSLTKRLVELHDGRVFAYSRGLSTGSTFTVALPGTTAPVDQTTPPLSKTTTQSRSVTAFKGEMSDKKKHSILIVDDNTAAALGLSSLLKHRGHTTEVVHDGYSALEQVHHKNFSVILLDIGLPDIDGYEIARRIFKNYPDTQATVVALTGFGQAEDKQKAKEAGFDYHLTKPISFSDLEVILASVH